MKTCAFLTCRDLTGTVCDDLLAVPYFLEAGWKVVEAIWDDPRVKWATMDAVVIRSSWDYQWRMEAFVGLIDSIARSGTELFNSAKLVRWNVHKTYLLDLERDGVSIVPTLCSASAASHDVAIAQAFQTFETDTLIAKPVVGANSVGIVKIDDKSGGQRALPDASMLIQPLLPAVLDEGELSLIFFEHAFSHAVRKIPRAGDFRSQEDFGACICLERPEAKVVQAAHVVLECLDELPLYSRLDFVMDQQGIPRLMEIELIEPSLYFRLDPASPQRFADAFLRRFTA